MSRRTLIVVLIALGLALPFAGRVEIPAAPPETRPDYGFAELNPSTMKSLLSQGSLIIVRQRPDLTLINVTSGALVNAPLEKCWEVITDFEHYPEFMPQTTAERIVERDGDTRLVVEQTIGVKIWKLPSVDVTYQLVQELTPPNRLRFWHISGTLEGTYGGWDLVSAGDQTMIFYTLYSNLTALGWGLGSAMKAEPDFMTGVNMTTAIMVTKAVKEETERRQKL